MDRCIERPPATRGGPRPWRELARDGLVRVHEYRCTAAVGDPPQPEQFPRASISIVRAGAFGIRSEAGPRLLTSGFLLIGNPGQHYEAFHDRVGGDRCLVFDFQGTVVEELADSLRSVRGPRPFATSVLPPLPRVDAFRLLAEQRLAAGADSRGLEELGLALAAYVVREAGAGTPRARDSHTSAGNRERIYAAIAFLERTSSEALGLSAIAAAVGLSPFHFVRLFKRETGVTPYRFLIRTRIRRAIELLRTTAEPITAIAYAVGFGDLSNFINTFRRELGCSPRQFRDRLTSC